MISYLVAHHAHFCCKKFAYIVALKTLIPVANFRKGRAFFYGKKTSGTNAGCVPRDSRGSKNPAV